MGRHGRIGAEAIEMYRARIERVEQFEARPKKVQHPWTRRRVAESFEYPYGKPTARAGGGSMTSTCQSFI